MQDNPIALTPMDLARYYMKCIAMQVDADYFQELCRDAAYAIDPAQTAYRIAMQFDVTDLPTPDEIYRAGRLPE